MNLRSSMRTWELKYITVAEMDRRCSTFWDQNKLFMFLLMFNHRVDTEMNCHITGSLIPPHTGCMRWLSVHDTEYASEIKRSGYTNTCFHVTIKVLYLTQLSLYSSFVIINVLLKSSVLKVDQGIQASKLSRMNKNTEYSRMKMAWWNLNGHISPERGGTLRNDISLMMWRFCLNTRMYVKVMFASMVLLPVSLLMFIGEKMPLQLEVACSR